MARAAGRVRRTPFVAVGTKRISTWFQFQPLIITQASPGTATMIFSLNSAALALRPFTVVRTLFTYHVLSDQVASGEFQIGAIGMAVVSDQAVAIGVTAVPTPITDMASDLWFAYSQFNQNGSGLNAGQVGYGYELHSKAMRKVDVGEDIIVVVESSGSASAGYSLITGGRLLVKTH